MRGRLHQAPRRAARRPLKQIRRSRKDQSVRLALSRVDPPTLGREQSEPERAVDAPVAAPEPADEQRRRVVPPGDDRPAKRPPGLRREAPGTPGPARRLGDQRLGLAKRQIKDRPQDQAQSSAASFGISSGKGAPWNMLIRSQRSDRGSNFVAPKNDSLARRRSSGSIASEIVLSRISA